MIRRWALRNDAAWTSGLIRAWVVCALVIWPTYLVCASDAALPVLPTSLDRLVIAPLSLTATDSCLLLLDLAGIASDRVDTTRSLLRRSYREHPRHLLTPEGRILDADTLPASR